MRDRFFYFCIRCCCRWTSLVGCVSLSPSFLLNLAVQVKLESCARLWLVVHLHFEGNKNWKQPFNSRLRGEQQLTTYLTVYCFSQKCFSNVLQIWDRQLLEIRSRCFSKTFERTNDFWWVKVGTCSHLPLRNSLCRYNLYFTRFSITDYTGVIESKRLQN